MPKTTKVNKKNVVDTLEYASELLRVVKDAIAAGACDEAGVDLTDDSAQIERAMAISVGKTGGCCGR